MLSTPHEEHQVLHAGRGTSDHDYGSSQDSIYQNGPPFPEPQAPYMPHLKPLAISLAVNVDPVQDPLLPSACKEDAGTVYVPPTSPATKNHIIPSVKLDYELPKTVTSVRDGWQWTCQSGAVVSGLLAGAAAQLIGFFKSDDNYNKDIHGGGPGGARGFVIASCYAALFLNIGATISSFVLIDNLGEVGFSASVKDDQFHTDVQQTGRMTVTQEKLLVRFGASEEWSWMLIHWLITFYAGILSLTVSVLTYVMMEEPLATKIFLILVVAFTVVPSTYFIFIRPCWRNRRRRA
ncbi:hypothetical protein D9613_010977 [Agrocybe pediades]|uniref:Transmembrane protein n=1 Tax=Agrocybe pediades TaxID=84607 RepID=A0A8H4QMH4_9AGAR|nr:hypothetical protein D9613_010977 [Agrocybe pediades]